jgi:hypothetical protein
VPWASEVPCRLTNRCSDPGAIKCSAAGGRASRPHPATSVPAC